MENNILLSVTQANLKLPNGRVLFENFHFTVYTGQITVILGENGSGKSTLLRALAGDNSFLQASIAGDLKHIAFLPQNENDFSLPVLLGEIAGNSPFPLLADELMNRPWSTASGGERKKALISRCLNGSPKVLLLDEPFNHLDRDTVDLLCSTFEKFCQQGGGILLVSHVIPEGISHLLSEEQEL